MKQEDVIQKLAGANMDIDLTTPADEISWEQSRCPWNVAEDTTKHRCAVRSTSICKYFCGIDYLDTVKCCYPKENPLEQS